jgi:predicted O-methyltransferase YrrM
MIWRYAKKITKAILPHQSLQKVLAGRARLCLAILPSLSFHPANLRIFTPQILAGIFTDNEIALAWEKDHPVIKELYGDDDKAEGINPGDRRALYYLIMTLKPRIILEVGTHIGASTLYIACALKRLNEGGKVTTVDILDVNDPLQGAWKHLGLSRSPKGFAEQLRCVDRITFHEGSSLEYMRTTKQRYDLIFLDGDHRADTVYQEVSLALPLLNANGVLLLHDYYPGGKPLFPNSDPVAGPFYALKRIKNENHGIKVLPLGALPWPTKQGTSITSLAVLTG